MGLAEIIDKPAARAKWVWLSALLLAMADPAAAQEQASPWRGFLHDDAVATLHLRSYYLDRSNPAPPNNVAWAGGGWIGSASTA